MNEIFPGVKRLHFVGIGGVGMSCLAEVSREMGFAVSGSDLSRTPLTERLRRRGIRVRYGHRRGNLGKAEVLIYSAAVPRDNPELKAARAAGVPLVPRTVMLDELMRGKYGIGVAGTHGKTTVAAMIAAVLVAGGLDPTVAVGGALNGSGSGARLGRGDYIVAEACEYEGAFLDLNPALAVVTNVEREHMEYYRTLGRLHSAFRRYIERVPSCGFSLLCLDDPVLRRMAKKGLKARVVGYATGRAAKYRCADIEYRGLGSRFNVLAGGVKLGSCRLRVPGAHNVANALAAVAVGRELGIKFSVIRRALAGFRNAERRFDIRKASGLTLVDDYAHHPTEIAATLAAARPACGGRLLCIFQPHLYSRTRLLATGFARSLALADEVVVTDIYGSREKRKGKESGELLVKRAARVLPAAKAARFSYTRGMSEAVARVERGAARGDWILTLGAGDIWKARDELLERISVRT